MFMPWPLCLIVLVFGTFMFSQYCLSPDNYWTRTEPTYFWNSREIDHEIIIHNNKSNREVHPIRLVRNDYRKRTKKRKRPSMVSFKTGAFNDVPLYVITVVDSERGRSLQVFKLGAQLALLPNFTWLLVQDGAAIDRNVDRIVRNSRVGHYRYLTISGNTTGVSRRNRCLNVGLEWVRSNAKMGVFYFADLGNEYDLRLFEEIAGTWKVSMFPVGLMGRKAVVSPVLNNKGNYIGFYGINAPHQKFPILLENFAISVTFLKARPDAGIPNDATSEAEGLLQSLDLFEPNESEFLAGNCTRIYVWSCKQVENVQELSYVPPGMLELNNLGRLYGKVKLKMLEGNDDYV